MNEQLIQIALRLKELGARTFGGNVWEKSSDTPMYAGVTIKPTTRPIDATTILASLQIPLDLAGKEFVPVRLAKGVPLNKAAYDIFQMRAVRAWAPKPGQKGEPIKIGDTTYMAY